ncbi:hypothetical protein L596_008059 [Steinernema carpocapsae]|uniref:Innexin n=1 Tax=Steinernema carpocapsae TaxID=34508 RepID=A0A4V6A669_STECR|nr:hypothetical protein L596_008059 [Steinernema carpocapsae]
MNIVQGLLGAISPLPDGDLSDRLNYAYTTTVLVISSAFITGWSFVGTPIQCWFPAYYKGWWIEYALDYCYVQNTYFLGFTEVKPNNYWDIAEHIIPIPKNVTERDEKQIGYYQWVPFILALQALMFFFPVVLWRSIYNSSGMKVKAICETCSLKANMDPTDRSKNMNVIAKFLTYEYEISDHVGAKLRRFLKGNYLTTAYILVKAVFALNAVVQFFMVKYMLGTSSIFWGLEVANDLVAGREWQETGNFPRVTMCDFAVRVLGNLHRHTVQCVLMINMFNEKIFVFLWFWLAAVAVCSLISFIYWTTTSFVKTKSTHMVSNYLEKIDPTTAQSPRRKALVRRFIDEKLRNDGVFLLRLVASNGGDMVACDLVSQLWNDFVAESARRSDIERPLLKGPVEEEDDF